MEVAKVALVVMAGLGSTWVARSATDAWLGAPAAGGTATALVQAAAEPAPAGSGAAQPEGAPRSPPAVPQMTPEEVAEELRRAEAEIAGAKSGEELKEFRPTRPLSADLAIALPSDI